MIDVNEEFYIFTKYSAIYFTQKGSPTEAIYNLIRLADKMTETSDGIACVLYEMILDKLKVIDFAELAKCELQFSYGKFLVKLKDYEKANKILKAVLEYSEENNVSQIYLAYFLNFLMF